MAYEQFPSVGAEAKASSETIEPAFLLELMVTDLHWASLQIGMVVMMSMACAASVPRCNLHSFRHLVYDDSRVMRLALRYAATAGVSAENIRKIDQLFVDLGLAQKQVAPFVEALSLTQGQRDGLGRLLPTLRKLAQSASDALAALEPLVRSQLAGDYVQDSGVIRQFLGRAIRGEKSEIDRFGVLTPPAIKQRRHSPRAPVKITCRLIFDGGEAEASVIDVSREGIGIMCSAPVAEREEVTILMGGRRLEAIVARRQGDQLGLLLRRTLALTDPLFKRG